MSCKLGFHLKDWILKFNRPNKILRLLNISTVLKVIPTIDINLIFINDTNMDKMSYTYNKIKINKFKIWVNYNNITIPLRKKSGTA